MNVKRIASWLAVLAAVLPAWAAAQSGFDHSHAAWDALVRKHVVLLPGGNASRVNYDGFRMDEAALKAYTDTLAAVSEEQFEKFSPFRRMAFLINAYNALTVAKVLQRYPNLKSIRDFGGLTSNPWKDKFFKLFGRDSTLDEIEHDMLRRPGVYDEPRIHFALNCAAVGCPMLREEAYVHDRLDAQLEDQAKRFLSDRSRNRFNAARGALEVSKIFDWYKVDWSRGYKGIAKDAVPVTSLENYFSRSAALIADRPEDQKVIADGKVPIRFLDYDWALNRVR